MTKRKLVVCLVAFVFLACTSLHSPAWTAGSAAKTERTRMAVGATVGWVLGCTLALSAGVALLPVVLIGVSFAVAGGLLGSSFGSLRNKAAERETGLRNQRHTIEFNREDDM